MEVASRQSLVEQWNKDDPKCKLLVDRYMINFVNFHLSDEDKNFYPHCHKFSFRSFIGSLFHVAASVCT